MSSRNKMRFSPYRREPLKENKDMKSVTHANRFTIKYEKHFVHEMERPMLSDGIHSYDIPSFMTGIEFKEGDEVEVAWKLIARRELVRIPVEG